jgi:glycosyltransferase involved in cell wall biosynthesis
VFVAGTCFSPVASVQSLSLACDGEAHPVSAHGMPRLDYFRSLHPGLDPYALGGVQRDPDSLDDPQLRSYRSGFWGFARIARPGATGRRSLQLHAELDDGQTAVAELGEITLVSPPDRVAAPWPESAGPPRIAICMAAYNPPPALFERQLESIRAQTHQNWICVISDDCSDPEGSRTIERVVGGDPRFVVSRSPRRSGFYKNFERALALAPADAEFVAMSDQDDRWDPDKLATLLGAIGDSPLVYSDARIVDRNGRQLADSYWGERRNNHSSLLSLLVANAVTGAASLLRRDLLDYALPFPPAQFAHYHDHWIGLTALSLGEIAYVKRPLYDYVQHSAASLGHAAATSMPSLTQRLVRRRALRERVRMWRLHYFVDVCRLMQFAYVLELRCGKRMTAGKRRVLRRFLRADRALGPVIGLALRGARELTGRPETLGAEWMLAHALVWRRLLALSSRDRPYRLRLDAAPPPTLIQKPRGIRPGESGAAASALSIADKIRPLELAPSSSAPVRVNLLIPTIDLEHFFGGYIGKFNLALRLAARGLRVRILTVDPVPALPHSWRRTLASYSGLDRLFDSVEVEFGRGGEPVEVSRDDTFIATTWWTAHIAWQATQSLGHDDFMYLIQEYEPFTFPMGSFAALAAESYRLPHRALFSSELLRDYFRMHRIGVFHEGIAAGKKHSRSFQNAITDVRAPTAAELSGREPRKLLFYARPEPHAARNMFELGVLALTRALEAGAFTGWELYGIGTVEAERLMPLGDVGTLQLIPREAQHSYADTLRAHDVGLALMYTPHPSLVPIEMAAAGMLTVTNSFENKTSDALRAISTNLIAAEPSIDAIADSLCTAAAQADDVERRTRGSSVSWSRDWATSLPDELMGWTETMLLAARR